MKKIFVILLLFSVTFSFAQKDRTLKVNKDLDLIEVTYYHDNGKVSQTGFYTLEGKLHGEWLSYCVDGNRIISAKYDNGVKVGKWFYWNADKLTEVDYSKNKVANVSEWTNNSSVVSNK